VDWTGGDRAEVDGMIPETRGTESQEWSREAASGAEQRGRQRNGFAGTETNNDRETTMNAIVKEPKTKAQDKNVGKQEVKILPPRMGLVQLTITGTSPLVINRFSQKAAEAMRAKQEAGSSQSAGKKKLPPKDFNALFEAASYRSEEGWYGVNASSFRLAMIGACRLVGFQMTKAKLAVFVRADGTDALDGTPLVRIYGKPPIMDVRPARNDDGGFDLRSRPMWKDWNCKVNFEWDLDQFSVTDIVNLLDRVGRQCGIGEGRASSKMSAGIGWGFFSTTPPKAA
jgi:hypothetical protein